MAEWPNVPDSKSGVPQGTVGSNPTLSAKELIYRIGGTVALPVLTEDRGMNRATILTLLSEHRDAIATRFGAKHLALFGSAARDEMRADSDVDVRVDFDGPASFDAYFNLKDYLETLLSRPVDLVTDKGLKPRARQHVERNLIRVS